MYLSSFRGTSSAALRLSSFYKFSSLGKLNNRGIERRAEDTAVNTRKKQEMENDEKKQTPLSNESEEISALCASKPKHKRRSRVESITDFSQLKTSTSNLQSPSFVSKNQKLRRTHYELDRAKYADEPFDIYLVEKTRQALGPRSCGSEEDTGIFFPSDDNVVDSGKILRPGMVLFKNYISLSEQVEIVSKCRELGRGPGGFYRPGYNDGAKLRLHMMCLGLDWDPQTRKYGEKRSYDDNVPPKLPPEFTELVNRVLNSSHGVIHRDTESTNVEKILPLMSPDVCIVNFYASNGRLGLHQDRDESRASIEKGLPVVSVSIGDSAEFLYGDRRDTNEADRVLLESGDVLIFGGESRLIYHGVKSVLSNTAPRDLLESVNLRPGRLNLTFRRF